MKATHAYIEKETLTDGSIVYNVVITDNEPMELGSMIIPCFNKKAAEDLLASLDSNALIHIN